MMRRILSRAVPSEANLVRAQEHLMCLGLDDTIATYILGARAEFSDILARFIEGRLLADINPGLQLAQRSRWMPLITSYLKTNHAVGIEYYNKITNAILLS